MGRTGMAYISVACAVMADIGMADMGMAYKVMTYIGMAYIGMLCVDIVPGSSGLCAYMLVWTGRCMRIGTCASGGADVRMDMCTNMCIGMHAGVQIEVRTDKRIDTLPALRMWRPGRCSYGRRGSRCCRA